MSREGQRATRDRKVGLTPACGDPAWLWLRHLESRLRADRDNMTALAEGLAPSRPSYCDYPTPLPGERNSSCPARGSSPKEVRD